MEKACFAFKGPFKVFWAFWGWGLEPQPQFAAALWALAGFANASSLLNLGGTDFSPDVIKKKSQKVF